MGEGKNKGLQDLWSQYNDGHLKNEDPRIIDKDQSNCQSNDDAAAASSSLAYSVNKDSIISTG